MPSAPAPAILARLAALLMALALPAAPVLAQQSGGPIPEKRLVVSRNVDFYGGDLQPFFDTTLEACQQLCLGNDQCRAFTFNSRSNACFPKTDVTERTPYDGALSGVVVQSDPAALQRGRARAEELDFLRQPDLDTARQQAQGLGADHPGGAYDLATLRRTAAERRGMGDLRAALDWTGAAAAQGDAAADWLDYATLLLEVRDQNGNATRAFRERALPAAINAYLRSADAPRQADALEVMARALEMLGRGRDMIPALRLADRLDPRDALQARLEDAVGKYGFRITDHRVESDLASPRVCAEFSEPLVRAGVDYGDYLQLPSETLAVEAEGSQLCISGMEHGARIRATFREGLPAESGEVLSKDVTLTLYVRDRAPAVRFPGRTYVLPRAAEAGVPVETVNTDRVELTLSRISDRNLLRAIQEDYFARPLSYWERQGFDENVAEQVWQGEGDVANELNADMTTRLPMGKVLEGQAPGIYALTARVPGADPQDEPGATQWFVLTDLGLTTMAGTDGLHVIVRSLASAQAREGVELQLISRSNRVLGTAETDAEGHARFAPGLSRGTGGAEPSLVVARVGAGEAPEDMAFLPLTDAAFDLSDRGVAGREAPGEVDMFLATDRGAYRAGEAIHATALARDAQAQAVEGLPVTAVLTRPDGVEYARKVSAEGKAGGHVFDFPLGNAVPRGTWTLDLRLDPDAPPLASTQVLVEDFLPERIDFDLSLPEGPLDPGSRPPLEIAANYLFGAPAGDLPVEGRVFVRSRDGLEDWPGYRFGRHDEPFNTRTESLDRGTRTDAQGAATLPLALPEIPETSQPLEATARVTLAEGSGRPVEREITRPLAPQSPLIGIKPLFDGVVPEGGAAAFDLVGVGPDMEAAPMEVTWRINRVETRYQWYQMYGNWNWEETTSRTQVASGNATLGDGPVEVSGDVNWGQYELVVERTDGDYAASSVSFDAGWYAPAGSGSTPDMLELSLDRPAYRPGDTAQLRIVPRYAGTALVTVLSNEVISRRAVEVEAGETLIPVEVTEAWGAGAYVTAQVIRPMDAQAGHNPARSLGLAYAKVDPGDKQLAVSIETDATSDPRGPLEASVRVDGVAGGETAFVTVAAVDEGILNLTGYDAPDPSAYYFGQRRLGVEIRDVYGRLIDGLNGAMGEVRSGGDAGNAMRRESPPPTEELVAFFSGPLEVGPDGTVDVSFDIPDFNGTVRLMAVAWSPRGVGQAERDVLVRDPVVVTASLPRFLSPGDQSRMLLELVHADGPAGRMGLDVTAPGLGLDASAVPSGVTLEAQGKQTLSVPITAGEAGEYEVTVALTTPDGKTLEKTLTLPVQSNDPEIATTRRFELASGDTFTLGRDVFAGLRPGTGEAMLSAGPLARFDAPGLLAALDRYPYGCTEQVTSQALPLLYYENVAQVMGLGHEGQVAQRIRQSIDRVLARQDSSGAFGLWRPGSGDFWLDAYVSDFLSRAKAQGFDMPETAFRSAMDNLRNRVNYAPDFDEGGEDIAYALMVLAREGAAAMGDLRYYADVKGDAFATPLAQAQLGAALASYGDQGRADAMFAKAVASLRAQDAPDRPLWRADYGTVLRDTAGVLALAAEAGSQAVDRPALAARVAAAGHPLSTQEQAWSLLAAHAMSTGPDTTLRINGQPTEGPLVRVLEDDMTEPLAIANTGTAATPLTLTTFGRPEGAVEKSGYGFTLDRAYYTMEGQPVQAPIRQGDRMVVVLTVTPAEPVGARLIVDDPLPAGLEIDNPNLLREGDVRGLDWLTPAEAEHAEFRADRFFAQMDWNSADPFRLAYIVRAVSPGAYHHPAAIVEDMYRPQYRARTASGQLTVAE
ncbi:alpha-2-macroglobulin family protein [Aquicoccus sp. SCR17]|nr:alpha-2-macroglobulin family protein [Carideicomes alvinocaridis]